MACAFLLSPASCSGLRARMIMRPGAGSLLARRLREPLGAPLGEVYTFLSGLYFRGKLAYARAFADRPEHVLVITPTAGLRPPDTPVTLDVLDGFARIDIANGGSRFRRPLLADARGAPASAVGCHDSTERRQRRPRGRRPGGEADEPAQGVLAGPRRDQGRAAPVLRGRGACAPAARARPRHGDAALSERRHRRGVLHEAGTRAAPCVHRDLRDRARLG